jgi:hypothetical protein
MTFQQRLERIGMPFSSAQVGSLANINHTPKGGNVKIINEELDFSNVTPKVGLTCLLSRQLPARSIRMR